MKEIEFRIPGNCDLKQAGRIIEEVCKKRGLHIALKGSLATYPGCIHWHYRKPGHKGTLELTLHIPTKRIWAKVQKARQAEWIEAELPLVRQAVESALCS